MLSELRKYVQRQRRPNVLILILLDHALRESWWKTNHHFKHLVLILILLDHALRDLVKAEEEYVNYVLILILLDHALRVLSYKLTKHLLDVLILILLDHALRVDFMRTYRMTMADKS